MQMLSFLHKSPEFIVLYGSLQPFANLGGEIPGRFGPVPEILSLVNRVEIFHTNSEYLGRKMGVLPQSYGGPQSTNEPKKKPCLMRATPFVRDDGGSL